MHDQDAETTPAFLPRLIDQLRKVVAQPQAGSHHVSRYIPAHELETKLDLALSDEACDEGAIVSALQQYLYYTPKTWHADFNKLLFSGIDGAALLADWITSLSNTTMHTYQVAPVATLMEQELVKSLNRVIGFEQGDGLMVSGGSMANMVAMLLARHRLCPNIKKQGYSGRPLVAYISELSHYSFYKAANLLGIGTQNLVPVASDEQGRMDPGALANAIDNSIAEHKQPFFIGLTAGTTVIGSFDPAAACAEIAKRYGLWLHIDGAWGGPVLLSEKHRNLLPDTALADSFTWDAHKLMSVPLTASVILVNDTQSLQAACGGGGGDYLFHEDENAAYNLGSKSLQCGRRVDSLKFWLSWKALGREGYAQKIDKLMALKEYMLTKLSAQREFELLAPASFLNVLFRFVPDLPMQEEQLARLNVSICKEILKQDLGFVDYAQHKGRLGIRFILANEALSVQHIDRFIANCRRIGQQLSTTPDNAP